MTGLGNEQNAEQLKWRPDGTLAMSVMPWKRACGENCVVCDGRKDDENGNLVPCDVKESCLAYEPDLTVKNADAMMQRVFLKEGETETMLHTTSSLFYSWGLINCDTCARECKTKNPRKASKCTMRKPSAIGVLNASEMMKRVIYAKIISLVNDYNVCRGIGDSMRIKIEKKEELDISEIEEVDKKKSEKKD